MIDFGAEDLRGWAERRAEQDLRRVAVQAARQVVPQTAPLMVAPEQRLERLLVWVAANSGIVQALLDGLTFGLDQPEISALSGFHPEPAPETRNLITEAVACMPDHIRGDFQACTKGISWEEAESVAANLSAVGQIDDPEKFAGFLYWSGR